jgi:hypothetical protein
MFWLCGRSAVSSGGAAAAAYETTLARLRSNRVRPYSPGRVNVVER